MVDDELLRAVGYARNQSFADAVALVIGLAAETHPEEIRKALGSVFDLAAVEETTKRMMVVCSEVQAGVREMRREAGIMEQSIQTDLDDLGKRLDAMHERIDKMHDRINDASRKFAALPKVT